MKPVGVYVPLVTPVDSEGRVDRGKFKKIIDYVVDNGADGLMPVAGTGEYVSLVPRERRVAVEVCVEQINGALPVFPGVIPPGIGDAVETGKDFKRIGADGVMVLTPYYTSVACQEDVVDYFTRFSDEVGLPFMIENLPSRTGINVLPSTMSALLEKTENFVSVKECIGDPIQFSRLLKDLGERISVLCGMESMMTTAFLLGSPGGVIATANLFPLLYKRLLEKAAEGDLKGVMMLHYEMVLPLAEIIYAEPNPGPMKFAMRYLGIDSGAPLVPVKPASARIEGELSRTLDNIVNWIKQTA